MKIKMLFALLFVLGNITAQEFSDSSRLTYMKDVVTYLASDSLEGRASGSKGEKLAADFIGVKFSKNKRCKVTRQNFSFRIDSANYNSQNVLCFINNGAAKTVLIMAHYDHIGWGGTLSKSSGIHAVHKGADDNASGVALMLDLVRLLPPTKAKCNYLFVAFSGHELGLFGSKYFSEHLSSKYKKIAITINLDMVGRMDGEGTLYYDCTPDQENRMDTLVNITSDLKIKKSTSDRINILDSKWFAEKNIPGITFTTGMHSDYHKISDDVQYINFAGMLKVEKFIISYLNRLKFY